MDRYTHLGLERHRTLADFLIGPGRIDEATLVVQWERHFPRILLSFSRDLLKYCSRDHQSSIPSETVGCVCIFLTSIVNHSRPIALAIKLIFPEILDAFSRLWRAALEWNDNPPPRITDSSVIRAR